MAHGYAGVKEHGLERFAKAFAEAGFVVLVAVTVKVVAHNSSNMNGRNAFAN
jgi:fermentation-respiration switch protein FrsA (DUF1100 family)